MTAYVYILKCCDGTLYTGSTINLDVRLFQHQAGEAANYTRRRLPVELIWSWEFHGVDEAFWWEKRIQGWSHNKKLALIEGGLDAVRGWSVSTRST